MPTYTFKNTETGEYMDINMSISALDDFKQSNPELEQVVDIPRVIRAHSLKPDSGFRDVLKTIKKGNRGSNVNTF